MLCSPETLLVRNGSTVVILTSKSARYSHGFGWMWPHLERRVIKKDQRHAGLKDYLAQRERAGLISRQEAPWNSLFLICFDCFFQLEEKCSICDYAGDIGDILEDT